MDFGETLREIGRDVEAAAKRVAKFTGETARDAADTKDRFERWLEYNGIRDRPETREAAKRARIAAWQAQWPPEDTWLDRPVFDAEYRYENYAFEFFPNGQVTLNADPGGSWTAAGGMIDFVYEDPERPLLAWNCGGPIGPESMFLTCITQTFAVGALQKEFVLRR